MSNIGVRTKWIRVPLRFSLESATVALGTYATQLTHTMTTTKKQRKQTHILGSRVFPMTHRA